MRFYQRFAARPGAGACRSYPRQGATAHANKAHTPTQAETGPLMAALMCQRCRRILIDTDGVRLVLTSGATICHKATIRCVCGYERTFYPTGKKLLAQKARNKAKAP